MFIMFTSVAEMLIQQQEKADVITGLQKTEARRGFLDTLNIRQPVSQKIIGWSFYYIFYYFI